MTRTNQRLEELLRVSMVLATVLLFLFPLVSAQEQTNACILSYHGENQERIAGPNAILSTECGGFHSAPFGNWGVTSNYGHKRDANQFSGWRGGIATFSRIRIYEWNTCTTKEKYRPPSIRYYNYLGNTAQITNRGIAEHRSIIYRHRISCDNDRGCENIDGWSVTNDNNFMTIYELDAPDKDDLLTTLYFPSTVVRLNCSHSRCRSSESPWKYVSSSTSSSTRIDAQLRTRVDGYYDSSGCEWDDDDWVSRR